MNRKTDEWWPKVDRVAIAISRVILFFATAYLIGVILALAWTQPT